MGQFDEVWSVIVQFVYVCIFVHHPFLLPTKMSVISCFARFSSSHTDKVPRITQILSLPLRNYTSGIQLNSEAESRERSRSVTSYYQQTAIDLAAAKVGHSQPLSQNSGPACDVQLLRCCV